MTEISFFVPGLPKPGGSKKAFFNPKLGRSIIVDASNNKDWRASVSHSALVALGERRELLRCPLEFEFHFVMPRPQWHFRSGQRAAELKPSAPSYHTHAPDSTKLTRSTEDALTGVLWADDALVVRQVISKTYGPQPGCHVTVRTLTDPGAPPAPTAAKATQPQLF